MVARGPAVTRIIASTDRSSHAATNVTSPAAVPTNVPPASIRPSPADRLQAGSTGTRLPTPSTPVTANRCEDPATTVAVRGATARPVSAPGTTRTSAVPVTSPDRANTCACPAGPPVSSPPGSICPAADDRPQTGSMASSFPAASRPTATKAVVVPAGTSACAGLTAIDSSGPGTTSITVDAATRPEATTNRAVPARTPRKRPLSSSSPMASDRLQVGVSGTALPPASCPTARNCRSAPLTTVGSTGSRAIVTNGPGVTSTRASPRRSPAAATTVASPARPAVRPPRSSRSPTSGVRLHCTVTPGSFG